MIPTSAPRAYLVAKTVSELSTLTRSNRFPTKDNGSNRGGHLLEAPAQLWSWGALQVLLLYQRL